MHTSRFFAFALAGVSLAACSQTEQTLPFDPTSVTSANQTVSVSGGALSLPAGASLQVGNGVFSGPAAISLGTASAPAGAGPFGTNAGSSFVIGGPAGTNFNAPMIFEQSTSLLTGPDAWLASYVVTNGAGNDLLTDVDVDVTNGTLRARLSTFGTLTPVIPGTADQINVTDSVSAAVYDAPSIEAMDLFTGPVRTISQDCGLPTSPGRCVGVRASATGTLLNQFNGAVRILRPRATGALTLTGDPRTANGAAAAGSIDVRAVLRVRRPAGSNAQSPGAASIRIRASLTTSSNTRVFQAAGTNVLTISGATVVFEPSYGTSGVPVTFTINPTSATSGAFRFRGTVNLGNGTSGEVIARFPFTIGY